MPFEKGNTFGAKDPADLATSNLHVRCKPEDKAAWVRATQAWAKRHGKRGEETKLAAWVIETLNEAAEREAPAGPQNPQK